MDNLTKAQKTFASDTEKHQTKLVAKIHDCNLLLDKRCTKDALTVLGKDLEVKLKSYIADTNQKVVSKIATTCDQVQLEVKDLNAYIEGSLSDINKKFDYQNTKIQKKLNRKAMDDMNNQYVKTRDEFQMQANALSKKVEDQQMRMESITKLFTKLNNELAVRDVALSRVPLDIAE